MINFITPTILIPVVVLTLILMAFLYYWFTPQQKDLTAWARDPHQRLSFAKLRHPMGKKDALPLLLLTTVYAATAFFQLGSTTSPQTFAEFGNGGVMELTWSEPVELATLQYFPGLGTGNYNVEILVDGHWSTLWTTVDDDDNIASYYWADAENIPGKYAMEQSYVDLFHWQSLSVDNPQYTTALRIESRAQRAEFQLGELALYDSTGAHVPTPSAVTLNGQPNWSLIDEIDTVPATATWYNSTYFDEIYHARTAFEHINGISPYEISHPPLGKLILSLGIQLFGMTPFGWRFMGVLFGIFMVPLLYIFSKNLFGKTAIATCTTAFFAFDFMHLTQTRIATIDTYGVFFILLMYYFLYRYLTLPAGTSFARGSVPLLLCGLSWGIGVASKWTVIYGGVGMAVLYFIGLYFKWRDWPRPTVDNPTIPRKFAPWCVKTILFSVLAFVLIPIVIYVAAYVPYGQAKNVDLTPSGIISGAQEAIPVAMDVAMGEDVDIPTDSLIGIVLENQHFMFTYHQGVHDEHPYESRWYQWIVDGRPILYYLDNSQSDMGLKTAFASFNNPILSWAGLLAILSVAVDMVRRRSGVALFIVVGYLSQLAPWMAIGRTTFAYHYFPSTLFLALALGYVFQRLVVLRPEGWKLPVYGLTAGAVACYVAFYPVLIGLAIPTWYSTNFLQWIPSWPI